jgi:hypothetical protein
VGTRYTTPQRMAWHATGGLEGGDPTAAVGVELAAAFDQLYVGLVSVDTAGFFPGTSRGAHVTRCSPPPLAHCPADEAWLRPS